MVRINLINPKNLTDQHLIAEYNEILILCGSTKKFPKIKNMPSEYKLGKGHITFFKNKIVYLQKRHELIKKEMIVRGFKPKKKISILKLSKSLLNDWSPRKEDYIIIKQRITERILQKPQWYRYYGKHYPKEFFVELTAKA